MSVSCLPRPARRAACLAGVVLALGVLPASSWARTIEPLRVGARPLPGAGFFRDRVIDQPPAAMAALTRGLVRRYGVPGGGSVEITLSPSFADVPENRAAAQSFADFLGSRVHGPEVSRLRVFIGTDAEVSASCGGAPGVLACYSRGQQRMFVPDRDPRAGGPFNREYAVTHEYGHHVAATRSNYPFPALNFGAKYWSSYMYVCARARNGLLFPGNQGLHYAEDSGEGFADTYAHVHYPSVLWQFAPILQPTAGSLAAVRRDVLRPWRGQIRRRMRGTLGSRAPVRGFVITQSLDGILSFSLVGPPGSSYDLMLIHRGQVVRRTSAPGSRDRMTLISCRSDIPRASFALRVVRRAGSGPFTVNASVVG